MFCYELYRDVSASPVSRHLHQTLPQVGGESSLRDLPGSHPAVLASAGQHVVVEGVPPEVEDRALMSSHLPHVVLHPARPGEGQHHEAPASANFHHNRQEFGIHCAVVPVVRIPSDSQVFVTLVFLRWKSINMSKF